MKKEGIEHNGPFSDKIVVYEPGLRAMHRRDLEIKGEGKEETIQRRLKMYVEARDIKNATK